MSKNYDELSEEDSSRDDKREARRHRRIRSQVIAWLVLILILAGIGYGGYRGVNYFLDYLASRPQPVTERVEEPAPEEEQSQVSAGVISTPEEEEQLMEEIIEEMEETDEYADMKAMIASMSLEQKAANLFLVSPEAITGVNQVTKAGDGTKAALEQYAVGGLIYTNHNVIDSDQFKEMIQNTKDMYRSLYNSNVWTIVKEDGVEPVLAGNATGIQKPDSALTIGDSGDSGNAYTTYINISSSLNDYGIDMNLGPVCDINMEGNTFLGETSFSSDADITASMVRQSVNAEVESGVIACLTSFPGLGASDKDPAKGEARIEKTAEEMKTQEFLPFQAGIEEGAGAILVSNVIAQNLTGDEVPCSMSATVMNDIIREELGFEGVIIAGPLKEEAITSKFESGEAVIMALKAGADMILQPEDFAASYQAVIDAVNDGSLSEERIDEALLNIYKLKAKEE